MRWNSTSDVISEYRWWKQQAEDLRAKAKQAMETDTRRAARDQASRGQRRSPPRLARLQKRLQTTRKKLEAAKATGAPTKDLEDKVYEIEDDLRWEACTRVHTSASLEADMQRYFRVSPPTVHQMILTLESRGLAERVSGEGRSIRLMSPRHELPHLE